MLTLENVLRKNPNLSGYMQRIKSAKDFEEVYEVFREINPNITKENIKKEILKTENKLAIDSSTRLSDDDLAIISGGAMNFDRFKSSALTALIALSGFAATEYMLPTQTYAISDNQSIVTSVKKEHDSKNTEELNKELFEAIKNDDTATVEDLMAKGADVNTRNKDGSTKLFEAAKNGDEQFVNQLIKYGAFVNILDNQRKSVVDYMHEICKFKNSFDSRYRTKQESDKIKALNNISTLLKNISEKQGDKHLTETKDENTRQQDLQKAFLRNTVNMNRLEQLINYGMNLNFKDEKGNTLIFYVLDNENIIKLLIDNGADVNIKNREGLTPLMIRTAREEASSVEKVRLLLDAGAKVDEKDNNGEDSLYKAVSACKSYTDTRRDIVSLLLEKDSSQKSKERAFVHAAEIGSLNLAKVFVEAKIDLESKNKYGQTVLSVAAEGGRENLVEYLLQSGADINSVDKAGNTALIYAIAGSYRISWTVYTKSVDIPVTNTQDKLKVAKLLIEKGADVNLSTKYGFSPLMACMICDCENDLVELMVAKGAKINQKDSENTNAFMYGVRYLTQLDRQDMPSSIRDAKKKKTMSKIEFLLKKDSDVKGNFINGETVLMYAINGRADISIIKALVEKGIDVNSVDKFGQTALIYAAVRNNLEVVKFLIDCGAKVNICDKEGYTPLMRAESKEVVELLLSKGANINALDNNGRSALMLAVSWTRDVAVSSKSVDIEQVGSIIGGWWGFATVTDSQQVKSYTSSKNINVVKALIDNGADVNLKDNDGQSIYSLAAEKDRDDVVNLLKDNKNISKQEMDKVDNSKSLLKAISENLNDNKRFEEIKKLLDTDLDVNVRNAKGQTALEVAVQQAAGCNAKQFEQEKEIVKMLLDKGANAKFSLLWTGKLELVNLLLSYGADATVRDKDGRTTLLWQTDPEVVKILIEHGADANGKSDNGVTALMNVACHCRNNLEKSIQVAKILIENGADLNVKNSISGETALMYAINFGDCNNEFAKFLVNNGADINIADKKGTTVFMHACKKRDGINFLKFLIEKGVDYSKKDLNGNNALYYAKSEYNTDNVIKFLENLFYK